MIVVHIARSTALNTQWQVVFKIVSNGGVSYYGVWTDANYNVIKHIESPDWNDIVTLFGINGFNAQANFGNARDDFLFNSPMIPNPAYGNGNFGGNLNGVFAGNVNGGFGGNVNGGFGGNVNGGLGGKVNGVFGGNGNGVFGGNGNGNGNGAFNLNGILGNGVNGLSGNGVNGVLGNGVNGAFGNGVNGVNGNAPNGLPLDLDIN